MSALAVAMQAGNRKRRRTTTVVAALALIASWLAPGAAAQAQRRFWPKPAAGASSSGDPEVVFTFDDGPDLRGTPIILAALARHRVHAIFFWVGRRVRGETLGAELRRALVARAVQGGHLVGNHTITHAQLCGGPQDVAAAEIDGNLALYRDLTGLPVRLFRVPYGSNCNQVRALLGDRGLAHLHWDIDPQEWGAKTADETAAAVIASLRHLQGRAVILMHDTKLQTARAVPLILDWIASENQARRASGLRPPIRIVSGSQLVAESVEPGVAAWARAAAASVTRQLVGDVRRVVPRDSGRRETATATTGATRQALASAPR